MSNKGEPSSYSVWLTILVVAYFAVPRIELWLADGQWARARVAYYRYNDGLPAYAFFDSKSGERIVAKCRGRCYDQLGLVTDGQEYRLTISDLPLLGKRILEIELYREIRKDNFD